MVERRRQHRVRHRRLRSLSFLVKLVLCFVIFVGFAYGLKTFMESSARFQVKKIRVEGANVLREEAVRKVAEITSADNVLTFAPEDIRTRVEAMAYVKECTVLRVYPDTIVIRIQEREPAAVAVIGNHFFEVDLDGVALRELDPMSRHEGPLITNTSDVGLVELGQQIADKGVLNALSVWKAFRETPLGMELTVSEIAPSPAMLEMICEEAPFVIRWGRTDFVAQAEYLNVWWRQVGAEAPCEEYLDLRFGTDLACK